MIASIVIVTRSSIKVKPFLPILLAYLSKVPSTSFNILVWCIINTVIKLLPIILIVILIFAGFIYYGFFKKGGASLTPTVSLSGFESGIMVGTSSNNDKVTPSPQPTASPETPVNTSPDTLDSRVTNIEKSLLDLQAKIAKLELSTTTQVPAQSTSNKYPLYIPLGAGGEVGDRGFYSVSNYQVTIDTADYSGYKNMQLEVNLRLVQSVGEAKARLFNSTDNSAIASSDVSTTSDKATLVTSGNFTLPSGKKTYVLQVQSTQGYTVQVQNARIKVNF